MDPNVENPSLSTLFGVDLERHGYIGSRQRLRQHRGDVAPGVFVAGAATGPETIDDSIAQGHAAALAALGFLQPQRASA